MKNIKLTFILLLICIYHAAFSASPCNSSTTYQSVTTCQSVGYVFYGRQLDSSGTYNDTMVLAGGCDSIISLQLQVIPNSYTYLTGNTCGAGSPYSFGGNNIYQPGTYYDTLFASDGYFCDSIIVLTLLAGSGLPTRTIYDTMCHSYYYYTYGYYFYDAGQYEINVASQTGGCDSLILINLTDLYRYTIYEYNGCPGQIFVSPLGHIDTVPGDYLDTTYITASGCDSDIYYYLYPALSFNFFNICIGDTLYYDQRFYTSAGEYLDTVPSSFGCDSLIALILYYNSKSITLTLCNYGDTVMYNGHIYTQPGDYLDTLMLSGACDTLVYVSVGFQLSSYIHEYYGCPGQVFIYDGHSYTTPGQYYDTLTAAGGCDSIIYLDLIVSDPTTQQIMYGCPGQVITFDGNSYVIPGQYIDSVTGPGGCQIIVNLVLYASDTFDLYYHDCAGQQINYAGQNYTFPGTYYVTRPSASCDSIIVLHLVSYPTQYYYVHLEGCAGTSVSWLGQTYSVPGIYFYATVSCDSMIQINVTDTSLPHGPPVVTGGCPGSAYTFHGTIFTVPVNFDYTTLTLTYYDTVPTALGCDSVYPLIVYVFPPPPAIYVVDSFCQGSAYYYEGYSFTSAGQDTIALPDAHGCDTMVYLSLSYYAAPQASFHIADSFCPGSTYYYGGYSFTSAGQDTITKPALNGCDTIVYLSLSYIMVPTLVIYGNDTLLTVDTLAGVEYQWLLGGQPIPGATGPGYRPLQNGSYSVNVIPLADTSCYRTSLSYDLTTLSVAAINKADGILLSPNPTSGMVNVTNNTGSKVTIKVMTLIGEDLMRFEIPGEKYVFDMNSLATGIYIIVISDDSNKLKILKLVKE